MHDEYWLNAPQPFAITTAMSTVHVTVRGAHSTLNVNGVYIGMDNYSPREGVGGFSVDGLGYMVTKDYTFDVSLKRKSYSELCFTISRDQYGTGVVDILHIWIT